MQDDVDSEGPSHRLGDEAALRDRYRAPHQAVLDKSRPKIDPGAAGFVAASPFIVLATTSPKGTDASPRGGPPGFVAVLDEQHLAFGDLSGNNRLDSYTNIVEHPKVGIIFLVPGVGETLRVNGQASVTTDPSVLERTAIDGVEPKVAVVVAVEECFIHCAKALRRSALWDPTTWSAEGARPSAAVVIADQFKLDIDPALIEANLEADYQATLWREGGR